MTIVYGHPIFDVKTGKDIDWHVNYMAIHMDDKVYISLEKHGSMEMKQIHITIQQAQDIGLINFDVLKPFLK